MRTDEPIRPDFAAILSQLEARGAIATPEQIERYERAQRRDMRLEALSSSGIHLPDDDRQAVLAGTLDRSKPAFAAVATWARGAPRRGEPTVGCTPAILVLCGAAGVGKTVAAAWWLSHVRGRALTITEAIRIYLRWKRSTYRHEEAEASLDTLARMDCLVLDELGQESDDDASLAREVLHWIVDRRQDVRRRTLVLTNLTAEDLRDRFVRGAYDGRTADRLARHGHVVQIAGESMRRPMHRSTARAEVVRSAPAKLATGRR